MKSWQTTNKLKKKMPNCLIAPYIPGTQALAVFPLVDPLKVRSNRTRFLRDEIPELELANSVYISGGRMPTRAWILLPRSAFVALQRNGIYQATLQLGLDECVKGGNALLLQNIAVVQARCVSRGIAGDPNAVYLVELTDGRGICSNRWFDFPLNAYYNCRGAAYCGNAYYADSLNSAVPWTWSGMVGNIWGKMSAFLGSFPGLPTTPTGTPEGFFFPGVSAWASLNDVLDLLGMTIAVNLGSGTPFTIVNKGTADAAFTTLQTDYAERLQDDLEWIDVGSGRVPGTVIVCFHRRNQSYGTEETIRLDAGLQWATNAVYTVSVSTPFTGALGTHYLWDDFQPAFDINSNILAGDATTAATIAAERVTQYVQEIYSSTLGYMRQTYAGIVPFAVGSQVDGVCFKQYRIIYQDGKPQRLGWRTQIARGKLPLWPQVERFNR